MRTFVNLPYFEMPKRSDVDAALIPHEAEARAEVASGSVIRVLLREGLLSGAVRLHTEQTLSGSEASTGIILTSTSEPHWTLKWFVVRGGFDWAVDWSAWPWDSVDNVFGAWPELVGVSGTARAIAVENVQTAWEFSATNAGLGVPPKLDQCDFDDLRDPQLIQYLARLSEAIEDEDEDILWGEFFDERFLGVARSSERIDLARLLLSQVTQRLRDGSYDEIVELSRVWGADDEFEAAVEWHYESSSSFADSMSWTGLPWPRQQQLLEQSSAWVRGLAAALPGTSPEVRRWLEADPDAFVHYVLEGTQT